jgi:hypothetical protein
MDQVDMFAFLDNVQFEKRSWQQRNRIKTAKGLEWLTVPVIVSGRFEQSIKDVEISDSGFWRKHLRSLEINYRRAQYFDAYYPGLFSVFEGGHPWKSLAELNYRLIEWLSTTLGIKIPFVRVSNIGITDKRSHLLAAVCRKLGVSEYLSPLGAAGYLLDELEHFAGQGISVTFHNYTHPSYNQLFLPFLPFASVIDLIFNEGPQALAIIRNGRRLAYSPLEVRELLREVGGKSL